MSPRVGLVVVVAGVLLCWVVLTVYYWVWLVELVGVGWVVSLNVWVVVVVGALLGWVVSTGWYWVWF